MLLNESIDALCLKPGGVYVDVTFGGGGHSREILSRLSGSGHLFSFDQDADAEKNVPEGLENFTFVRSNFRYLTNWMRYYDVEHVDGILADLGVSRMAATAEGHVDVHAVGVQVETVYAFVEQYGYVVCVDCCHCRWVLAVSVGIAGSGHEVLQLLRKGVGVHEGAVGTIPSRSGTSSSINLTALSILAIFIYRRGIRKRPLPSSVSCSTSETNWRKSCWCWAFHRLRRERSRLSCSSQTDWG